MSIPLFAAELQSWVVEITSGAVETLDGLRDDVPSHRRVPVETTTELDIGLVAARARGRYRAETVGALLAESNKTHTTPGSIALRQLAVLEMWLQIKAG